MRRGGFSLIEVLMATVIVSVSVVAIAGIQNTSLQISREARLIREATDLGSAAVGRLRAASASGSLGSQCVRSSQQGFTVDCSLSSLQSSPPSYLVRLEVRRGEKTYLNLNTVVSQP
ncbi:MAG: prepilin-type N-terminal cleavage/methylation domain-containing protein [Meiothermus sp.]|nr:prepilin-type N-terminal cleavage/methylation domain-containing protein [Meiothermus sp.]